MMVELEGMGTRERRVHEGKIEQDGYGDVSRITVALANRS